MKKTILGMICLGIIAFVIGDTIDSDFLENVGVGVFFFIGGQYTIHKRAHPKNHLLYSYLLIGVIISTILSDIDFLEFFDSILTILILIWIGYAVYFNHQHKKEIKEKEQKVQNTIQVLKNDLKKVHQEIQENNEYFNKQELPSYISLSRKIYPKLEKLDKKLEEVKETIGEDYMRLHQRIIHEAKTIKTNFEELGINLVPTELEKHEDKVRTVAPEIVDTYRRIQIDHQTIVAKLKDEGIERGQELLALHESYMNRFNDIFKTYMEIKETPKNYYNADNRLEQARLAMEKIDLVLDEQLRQLNEQDLSDFEVSLRLMLEE